MQIEISLAISTGVAKSDALPLPTLEVDAQPSIETLGLGLADAKALLVWIQAQIVTRQVELMSTSQRRCDGCGLNRDIKDYHDVHYRSLFGSVVVKVPRWRRCECRCGTAPSSERRARRWISAELEYVQSRLAATIPYAKSSELLELLLPVAGANAASTVRRHTLDVGRRLDVQGLKVQPEAVDKGSGSNVTTVGLDGGYLRLCRPDEEKSFEVVAGRAMRASVRQRSVAFVRSVDCYLGRSKGDRQHQGRVFSCPALTRLCPVTAFNAWVSLAGLTEGPVFRKIDRWGHVADESLHANSLIPLLRSLFAESGVESPEGYSSHSMRRGFAGWARASGWDIKELMEYVGWKDVKSAMRYLEASDSSLQARFEQGLAALAPPAHLLPPPLLLVTEQAGVAHPPTEETMSVADRKSVV